MCIITVKNMPANAGDVRDEVRSLGWEDPLEKGMTTHSSLLAWRTPWTEEPGGLSPRGCKESDTIGVTQRALNSLCYVAESIFPGEFSNCFFFKH